MSYRVQTLNAISQLGLDRLPAAAYEVGDNVSPSSPAVTVAPIIRP